MPVTPSVLSWPSSGSPMTPPVSAPYVKTFLCQGVVFPNVPPNWGTWNFCAGYVSQAYDHRWDMENVTTPVTYSVHSGTLPPGLSLSSLTASEGHISGMPTTAGTYSFALRATNAFGTADQSFSIVISAAAGGGSYAFIA